MDTAEQLWSLQAVKIERQGVAVVDDADHDVDLSIGQIHRLLEGQYLHLTFIAAFGCPVQLTTIH